jgi:hypothetical protein
MTKTQQRVQDDYKEAEEDANRVRDEATERALMSRKSS